MRLRVGVALLLVLAALGAVNYLRPIPAVAPTHLLRTSDVVPGTAPSLPWPSRGSAAVGVSGLGLLAGSGNEQAIPAASVTKVMTVLVILADKNQKSEVGQRLIVVHGVAPFWLIVAGTLRVPSAVVAAAHGVCLLLWSRRACPY